MAYGLGGAGLAGVGLQHKQQAMEAAGQSAKLEQERTMANKTANAQRKAGNTGLTGSLGALAGFSVGGPVGALIGGVVGSLAGSLF